MPPSRTMSQSGKILKTERTHEENQERAYIAASRRSDRSLEARVESAKRASEIHKKRTGRGLRVTEQDVLNEEMYEEEDHDIPITYRLMAAQLNQLSSNNNPEFNQRIQNYLATQIGARNPMNNPAFFNTQFSPPPANPQATFGSPMFHQQNSQMQQLDQQLQYQQNQAFQMQQLQQMQQMQQMQEFQQRQALFQNQQTIQTQSPRGSFGYRKAPYPQQSPRQLQGSQFPNSWTQSNEVPQQAELGSLAQKNPVNLKNIRRNSDSSIPQMNRVKTEPSPSPKLEDPDSEKLKRRPSFQKGYFSKIQAQNPTPFVLAAAPSSTVSSAVEGSFSSYNAFVNTSDLIISPFSAELSVPVQQMVGSILNPNDSWASSLMAGNDGTTMPTYGSNYQTSTSNSNQQAYPSYDGLNTTLAPSSINTTKPGQDPGVGSSTFFSDALDAGDYGSGNGSTGSNDLDFSEMFDMPAYDEAYISSQ